MNDEEIRALISEMTDQEAREFLVLLRDLQRRLYLLRARRDRRARAEEKACAV